MYGELVVLAFVVAALTCIAMQQSNRTIQTLLRGQCRISELRRRTILRLEHENAELKSMLRAHEAQLMQLARRIELSEYVLIGRAKN